MVLSQGGSSWSVARSRAHTLPMKLTFTFKKTSLKGLTSAGAGGGGGIPWVFGGGHAPPEQPSLVFSEVLKAQIRLVTLKGPLIWITRILLGGLVML